MNKVYRIFLYFAFIATPIVVSGQAAGVKKHSPHKKKAKKHCAPVAHISRKANDSTKKREQVNRMLDEKTHNKPWKNNIPLNEPKK